MPITIREMAGIFANAQQRQDAERIHNQLRGATVISLLNPCDTAGPKGAFRFDRVEIAAARVLLALVDIGLHSDALKHINAHIRAEKKSVSPKGLHVRRSLTAAIEDTGEWLLEIVLMRSTDGKLIGSPSWLINSDRGDRPEPFSANSHWPHPVESLVMIPFSEIWRPISPAAE